MTAWDIIGVAAFALLMTGVSFCALVPSLPAIPIVALLPFIHRLLFGARGCSWLALGIIALFCATGLALDTIAGSYGARKMGAGKLGVIGAIAGGLAGLFFGLPGIIAGPFLGALVFEMMGGRKLKDSARAGLGATLGIFAGALGKFAICLLITILFCFSVLRNHLHA